MIADNYLDEVPATFNDLARRFGVPGVRADGVLEGDAREGGGRRWGLNGAS